MVMWSQMRKSERFFHTSVNQKILMYLVNKNPEVRAYATQMSKDLNFTYAYLHLAVRELKDRGFVQLIAKDRIKVIVPTTLGLRVGASLCEAFRLVEENYGKKGK